MNIIRLIVILLSDLIVIIIMLTSIIFTNYHLAKV
jgi:hypothetical protein